MAFKTFAPGVLTSSDMNTFLMNQAVITCTSSTRPSSPVEGMTIYETDTDLTLQYTGAAWVRIAALGGWTSHTATLSGTGWNFGTATVTAAYIKLGRFVYYRGSIAWNGGVTLGVDNPFVSLPENARNLGYPNPFLGIGLVFDQSLAGLHLLPVEIHDSNDKMTFFGVSTNRNSFTADYISLGSTYTAAGGNVRTDANDRWVWAIGYESAS